LYVKIRQIKAQYRWDHYACDRHYFGAKAMWFFRGPHNFSGFKAFERNHIISLVLRHLREIT